MLGQAREMANRSVELARSGGLGEALQSAHACYRIAPAGSTLSAWASGQLAALYADLGLHGRAYSYAKVYLHLVDAHPQLDKHTPFVLHAVGSVHYQQGRWSAAVTWYQRALAGFARTGQTDQVAVTSSNLAWALLRSGRRWAARLVLAPRDQFPADRVYLHDGAEVAILAAEGLPGSAVTLGRQVLSAPGRRSCDLADAAEVALVVARSLRNAGAAGEASQYIQTAAELCALQRWDAVVRLVLNGRAEGGDPSERQASSRGSANLLHRGCFATGVA